MNGNTKYAFVTYFYLYLYRADWVHINAILLQKFFETLATRYWFVGAGLRFRFETMIGIFSRPLVGMNVT